MPAFSDLKKFARFFDLANNLNLDIFAFLDLNNFDFNKLNVSPPTNLSFLAIFTHVIKFFKEFAILNIEVSGLAILLKP